MFLSGIDIGGTSIKFGIFDEQLNLLQQWSRPTPKEPAEAAALIAAQLEPYHVAAIGGRCARHAEHCARNHYGG